jgi:hypothetical protein
MHAVAHVVRNVCELVAEALNVPLKELLDPALLSQIKHADT